MRTVEILRDTVVTVKADTSLVQALVECDKQGRAYLRELQEYRSGDRLPPPKIEIVDNVLTATAQVDSMQIYMTLKDRYREATRTDIRVITREVEVNRFSWWQTLWIRLGQILAAVGLLVGGIKLYKIIKH